MYGIEGLLAGRTLADRYRIDEVIGRGGMGAVYRARDLRLNRAVAVKVISVAAPDEAAHERLRARFQREARAAAALHHPNVVAVYDFGTDMGMGLDFLVMELLRGEDLAARLARKGPPAVSTALQILYQAARGLAAGHRAGLIHRDVKPGNLFLEPGDRLGEVQVRVLDFGIAEIAAAEEQTMTHLTVVGRSPFSPAYASPEQLLGETGLTPATDVFSLGAVGFQLLTGRRAFSTADPREQVAQVARAVQTDLPRVAGLPTAMRVAIQRALSRSPRDRFPHAGAFAEAIAVGLPSDPSGEFAIEEAHAEDDDRTLLAPPAEEISRLRGQPAPRVVSGTRFATPVAATAASAGNGSRPYRPASSPGLESLVQAPASVQKPAGVTQPILARQSRLQGALLAIWGFLLTTLAFACFAGAWFAAVGGTQDGNLELLYLGTGATVAATPLALHRLMGSRGSLRFAVFLSIVASVATLYLLTANRDADDEIVLAALFVAQVLAVVCAEILTRQRDPEDLEDELAGIVDRAL